MTKRQTISSLLGILISLVFLGLALYRVDLNQLAAAVTRADYRLVLVSAVFTLLSYVFRTARWARFLKPQKQAPIRRLFPVLVIGFALNNVLPGRPGEFARAYALGRREQLSKTLGLATVVVERVFDGLTLIAVLALASLGFNLPGWGKQIEGLSVIVFGLALALLLLLLLREKQATALLHKLIQLLPPRVANRAAKMLASFILGLHSLRSPRDVVAIIVFSAAAWASEAVHYWLILSAFGILDMSMARVFAALFVMVTVNLSISIPAAPGGVGPFEWAGTLALSAFAVSNDLALSAVLVSHAVQFLLISGLGIWFTAREGIKLTQAVEQVEAERLAEGRP